MATRHNFILLQQYLAALEMGAGRRGEGTILGLKGSNVNA